MKKLTRNILIAVLVAIAVGVGAWYYFSRIHSTKIGTILQNPVAFEGKEVTLEGEVKDRTSFFVFIKFFKLKDKTGEIIVATKKSLPEVGSKVRLKGSIDNSFSVGDRRLPVFMEVSVEKSSEQKEKDK